MDKQKITEEMKVHEQWYKEAREMTIDKLTDFVKKLTENYDHDYGTICHAVAASSIAAACAVDHSPTGGITGFQASCIMWEFVRNWMSYDTPLRLVKYEDMLYPQYEYRFQKTIHPDTAKWLKEQAVNKLKEYGENASPNVVSHWKNVAEGNLPFGYNLSDD